MNRSIALVSAVLLLGAAPVAALAESNTQQQPAAGTYQAPSAPASGTQQQMPSRNQNMNGSASGANSNAPMSGSSMADTQSPEEVQRVQAALNQKGERVKVDGIWGPQTEQALRDFQRKNGLQASGRLDGQTLQKLNVASQ
jgi:murein L,D-transpeptidase YcbB/YkuD